MQVLKLRRWLMMLLILATPLMSYSFQAEARAGRGGSFGRSAPMRAPSRPSYQRSQPEPSQRGSFWRGVAGGVAGGLIGSTLFGSLAHGAGGSHGGMGLIELVILAGLVYFGFRWWQNQKRTPSVVSNLGSNWSRTRLESGGVERARVEISRAEAMDLFFKVQGAWTRRDLEPIRRELSDEVYRTLQSEIDEQRRLKQVNRLENIAVRDVQVLESWEEAGDSWTTMRFTANLLDYMVDETSGRVLQGSDSDPVKFEEDWTFVRRSHDWQLAGIAQV